MNRQELEQKAARLNVSVENLAHELGIDLQPKSRAGYSPGNVTIPATIDYGIEPEPLGQVVIPNYGEVSNQPVQPLPAQENQIPVRQPIEIDPIPEPTLQFPGMDQDLQQGFIFAMEKYGLKKFSPETMLIIQLMRDQETKGEHNVESLTEIMERLMVIEQGHDMIMHVLTVLVKLVVSPSKSRSKLKDNNVQEILQVIQKEIDQEATSVSGEGIQSGSNKA